MKNHDRTDTDHRHDPRRGLPRLRSSLKPLLRVDEAPIGGIEPAKAPTMPTRCWRFNLYYTLVYPMQGGAGVPPHLATNGRSDGDTYTFTLRDDVTFNSGNSADPRDVVFSYERMMALGQGNSGLFEGPGQCGGARRTTRALYPDRALRAVPRHAGAPAGRDKAV